MHTAQPIILASNFKAKLLRIRRGKKGLVTVFGTSHLSLSLALSTSLGSNALDYLAALHDLFYCAACRKKPNKNAWVSSGKGQNFNCSICPCDFWSSSLFIRLYCSIKKDGPQKFRPSHAGNSHKTHNKFAIKTISKTAADIATFFGQHTLKWEKTREFPIVPPPPLFHKGFPVAANKRLW